MIVRSLIAITLLLPSMAMGAVTCGTVTSDITATDRSSATVAYTTPAGSNQTLVVGIGYRDATGDTVATVTHAGNSATIKLDVSGTDVSNTAYAYIKNPAAGTNNVVVTFTGTVLASGIVIATCSGTHSDADPHRNAGNSATGTGTAISVTATDASGDLTLDVMSIDSNSSAPTVGANQTALFAGTAGSELGMGMSYQDGGLGGVMSWTAASSNDWAHVVAPLQEEENDVQSMSRRRNQ